MSLPENIKKYYLWIFLEILKNENEVKWLKKMKTTKNDFYKLFFSFFILFTVTNLNKKWKSPNFNTVIIFLSVYYDEMIWYMYLSRISKLKISILNYFVDVMF